MPPALRCSACGAERSWRDPEPFRCPDAADADDVDHLMTAVITTDESAGRALRAAPETTHPFIAFRDLLYVYHVARAAGLDDETYDRLVMELSSVASLHRTSFTTRRLTLDNTDAPLWTKNETGQAGGSHKIRHLFGVGLWLAVMEEAGIRMPPGPELAIASCGNAALAAALVADASDRRLNVFIPTDADPRVVDEIESHGATTHVCERRIGLAGDPCVHAFRTVVAKGQVPFTCQGSENGLVVDGGSTLSYEMVRTLDGAPLDDVVVHVGGGALASAVAAGFEASLALGVLNARPRFHVVQTDGGYPLVRAYDLVRRHLRPEWSAIESEDVSTRLARANELAAAFDEEIAPRLDAIARHRSDFMWPWETTPTSIATGILDDECYDWRAIVVAMLRSGGIPVIVTDADIHSAQIGAQGGGFPVCTTGAAGFAGARLIDAAGGFAASGGVGIILSGRDRG